MKGELLLKDYPFGHKQAVMGEDIIGQWINREDGNCYYESYGRRLPCLKEIKQPGMTYEERFGRS